MLSTLNPEDLLKAAHTANITEDCANAMLFILEAPLPKGLDFYNWKLQCKLTFLKSLTAYNGFYNSFSKNICRENRCPYDETVEKFVAVVRKKVWCQWNITSFLLFRL